MMGSNIGVPSPVTSELQVKSELAPRLMSIMCGEDARIIAKGMYHSSMFPDLDYHGSSHAGRGYHGHHM
jgi:hypothetical protein